MNPKAEKIRIRYLYRRKVLSGDIKVPLGTAKRLVGPDCAYHLYSGLPSKGKKKTAKKTVEVTNQ